MASCAVDWPIRLGLAAQVGSGFLDEAVRVAEDRGGPVGSVGVGEFGPRGVHAVSGDLPGVERCLIHLVGQPPGGAGALGSATRSETRVSVDSSGSPSSALVTAQLSSTGT